jgi:hypothetical protein
MSYKAYPRKSYGQRQKHTIFSLSHHRNFRQEWEANFDKAVTEANKFKDQGFLVEEGIEKGALTESQAKKVAQRLQTSGYEVQLIPVATWAGEKVVFVIFKPPKEQPKPQEPTPQPAATKQAKDKTQEICLRYFKTFWGIASPPPDFEQLTNKGYLIDPTKYTALILPTATSQDELVKMVRNQQATGTPLATFDSTPKFRLTASRNKNMGSRFVVFDTQGKIGVRIDYFINILKVLGKGKINVYSPGPDMPVYLEHETGVVFAIAPPTDLDATKAVTVHSLAMQSQTT